MIFSILTYARIYCSNLICLFNLLINIDNALLGFITSKTRRHIHRSIRWSDLKLRWSFLCISGGFVRGYLMRDIFDSNEIFFIGIETFSLRLVLGIIRLVSFDVRKIGFFYLNWGDMLPNKRRSWIFIHDGLIKI